MEKHQSGESMDQEQLAEPILDNVALEDLVNMDIKEDDTFDQELPQGVGELEIESQATTLSELNNRERALQAAIGQLGYREEPPGTNCNKFSRYFHKGCEPWCADFVSWAFDSTGNGDRRVPWGNPSAVASIVAWAQAHGHFVNTPAPGDIFTIQGNGISHCGIVRRVEGTLFLSVEGNTTRTGYSGCIWVAHHRRGIARGYRFVRVPTNPW